MTLTITTTTSCFRHLSTEIPFLRFLLDSWPQFFSELELKSDLLAESVSSSHLTTYIYVPCHSDAPASARQNNS